MRTFTGVLVLLALTVPALADTPEHLDRAMISEGVKQVKPQVMACGAKNPGAKGMVKVNVKVDGTGTPTNVIIKSTPSAQLGACVATAMQSAHFAQTVNGGSFTYPFVF